MQLSSQEKDEIKFDIYVKLRELKQIGEGFKKLSGLPEAERLSWLSEHENFLSDMMDSFLNETMGTIDGVALDSETLELSVELVSTMRDTMNIMHNVMASQHTS